MESYKKISIKAMDVKPGDTLTGRIETNRWPNQMTVKEVTLTDQVIHIKTTSGMVYHFASLHTFLKTISPAEEAETAEPISTGYEAEIEKLDLDITEYAVVILGNLEPHINTLKELEDGMITAQEIDNDDPDKINNIWVDIGEALNAAKEMHEAFLDMQNLKAEMIRINQAADEGPYGRNK